MEIKIIEFSDDYAKLLVKGEDHTLLNLLQYELVNDESVLVAKYNFPHPLKNEAELMIRTTGKNPIQAIREANERIMSKVDELLSQL